MSESKSLFRLFVGFILSATGGHTCPIELSPPSVVVKYGDPVLINCSTSDSLVEGMGWEASDGGTGIQPVKHLKWISESLTDWTIAPVCFINLSPNSSIEQCQKKANIVLYTFPENISISSSAGSNGSRENEIHVFSCDIDPIAPIQNFTVSWYRGDVLLQTLDYVHSSRKPVKESPSIKYKLTRKDNGATFRCEAHMDLRPEGPQLHASSQEYNVTVYFEPEFNCSHIELLEGETLENKCSVEGNPRPIAKWLKDEQLIDPSVPLSRENAGLYTIELKSDYWIISKTVQVVVFYEPNLTCPRNYTALEFAPHHITCTFTGYPKPNITWFRDGEEVDLPVNLTRGDAGQYWIIASNQLSTVSTMIDIAVTYPPSQIAELEDSEVEIGFDVSLKCSSVGNPRPKYVWTYYRMANVKEQSEDGVSRLLIHNATAYNAGSYTCHASNKNGNVSRTAMLIVRGATKECPIEITPNRMVIPYRGQTQTAECVVASNDTTNVKEVYWEAAPDVRVFNRSWNVDTTDWDSRPYCVATFVGIGTCKKPLDYTLYKTPDSVFVSSDWSSVVEGRHLQLQCNIASVAPARSLAVQWFQGNDTFEPHIRGSMDVSGCPYETNCNVSVIRSPVNVSSTISVTLNRTHTSVQFWCEAALNLGPEGPQPPPARSSPFTITVHSKPIINATKLPKTIPVFRGYPEHLVCEADGHPPPKIQWFYRSTVVSNSTLTVSEAGLYNCTATNGVDSSFYVVEVVLKEDYLPLIAGFVAVTVVAISVIFLFIYSIYYKNTKMRRYSLKNPKMSNHNGNVAHNGWDLQFPMTKLS